MKVDQVSLFTTSDLFFVAINSCEPGWLHGAVYKVGTYDALAKDEAAQGVPWLGRIQPIAKLLTQDKAEEAAQRVRQAQDAALYPPES